MKLFDQQKIMHMDEKITRVKYLLHCVAHGTVETVGFQVDSNTLSGTYLDYALACVVDYNAIVLSFGPGLAPTAVEVGNDFSNLQPWAPTANQELAKSLAEKYLDKKIEIVSCEELQAIVIARIGERIQLLKPIHI